MPSWPFTAPARTPSAGAAGKQAHSSAEALRSPTCKALAAVGLTLRLGPAQQARQATDAWGGGGRAGEQHMGWRGKTAAAEAGKSRSAALGRHAGRRALASQPDVHPTLGVGRSPACCTPVVHSVPHQRRSMRHTRGHPARTSQPDVHPVFGRQVAGGRGVVAAIDPRQGAIARAAQLLARRKGPGRGLVNGWVGKARGRGLLARPRRAAPCTAPDMRHATAASASASKQCQRSLQKQCHQALQKQCHNTDLAPSPQALLAGHNHVGVLGDGGLRGVVGRVGARQKSASAATHQQVWPRRTGNAAHRRETQKRRRQRRRRRPQRHQWRRRQPQQQRQRRQPTATAPTWTSDMKATLGFMWVPPSHQPPMPKLDHWRGGGVGWGGGGGGG